MNEFLKLKKIFDELKIKYEIRNNKHYTYIFIGKKQPEIDVEHLLIGNRQCFEFEDNVLVAY